MLDDLQSRFDLRTAPGPGIRAAVTGGAEGIDAATIDRCPDLALIAVCAVGYDKVDVAHARARGIAVTNTPDVLTEDTADTAIALMFAVYRRVALYDRYVRDGRWEKEGPPPLARKLTGRRIGILGLGRIGSAIAKRCAPFAGEIAYHSRTPVPGAPYRYAADTVALAAGVDVLVVATPGGKGTAGLVDRAVLDALGPDGTLINIARGSVVDEDALVAALAEGRLGAAGLDVFAHEPHVPEALLAMENVVLLPHQGSATVETRKAMADLVIANVEAFFAGKPLLTPVG
ncbi:2-hydroxyacid dehydrogenase [Sphingomonas fennica]|uniref:Hydroxyacid dehydrogenase n=1 Tax=Edaphosphingomonas fennica TaxID=114404 RepID=A0A2T4I7L4_9SPHN|nr:2-hydroxyacid dehydrogenase [Sphingomonas fennica]PTD27173.1 hydroxyacid dehydrogenase [Sphingomonas fennica]